LILTPDIFKLMSEARTLYFSNSLEQLTLGINDAYNESRVTLG